MQYHTKKFNYTIYNTECKIDVSLYMRICKEIMKKKTMKEKENVK